MEALGVFFVENWPLGTGTSRHHRLGVLDDGETQTIMLGENLRSGYDPVTGSGWGSPDIRYVGFMASGYVCTNGRCDDGNVDYTRTNLKDVTPYNTEALNAAINLPEGLAPWPSSLHPGKIYFAFCDGRVQGLSDTIDGRVYAGLLSPNGSTIQGPLAQQLLSAGDY
jgi:prepilin-type processing-associated H-X9-DG protein